MIPRILIIGNTYLETVLQVTGMPMQGYTEEATAYREGIEAGARLQPCAPAGWAWALFYQEGPVKTPPASESETFCAPAV